MKRENTDYFTVLPHHLDIHNDLLNWGRVVRVSQLTPDACAPIFKLYRTDPHYTDEPSPHLPKRPLDGFEMEKQVRKLPPKHRAAIRWMYVFWHVKAHDKRHELGVTARGLVDLVHEGRAMLRNRTKAPLDTRRSA